VRISVFGCGYLGVTQAACMAENGHEVVGVDIDAEKVCALSAGRVPFFEPELSEVVRRQLATGRLAFTTSTTVAVEHADVHFICVGTPQSADDFSADMTAVEVAVRSIVTRVTRPCLIVGKSTVPVGTTASLRRSIQDVGGAAALVRFAWSPEFLREGHAVQDTLRPDRIVIGVDDVETERTLRHIYEAAIEQGAPVIVTNFATAELVKTSANAFLATKVSFINAVADMCDATGADVVQLAEALGHDTRIGRRYLHAGLGYGGGCLPKDVRAFMHRAGELRASEAVRLLREVDNINQRRRQRVVDMASDVLHQVSGSSVGILGAAFKPHSDDVRDSPALWVAEQLQMMGATITVFDPQAMDNARGLFPTLTYAASAKAACLEADLVLLLTEWPEFAALSPTVLGDLVARRQIIDGRNYLDAAQWRAAGWTFRGIGK
jgi:UDPglucose 6-dehydrogenase